jgi:hypothetical protein
LCYIVSMKKARRAGATETFSVSVNPETKRALRALANRDFGGNLSALVTDLAEEARRRMGCRAGEGARSAIPTAGQNWSGSHSHTAPGRSGVVAWTNGCA